MTAALALAIMECFSRTHRAQAGAEARARIYAAQVELAAATARIDPFLVGALIERESSWHETAVGKKGELGLLQLLPHSDATKGFETHLSALLKAPVNIRVGVAWMVHKRYACRRANPLVWLSAFKGLPCGASKYSRAVVARAAELRAISAALLVDEDRP